MLDLSSLDLEEIASALADFADGITDERAGRRLARAIAGKGAFFSAHPDPALP